MSLGRTIHSLPLPSIRVRLARALLLISVVWVVAVAMAVWVVVQHEIDELMDHTLRESAEIIYGLLGLHGGLLPLDGGPTSALAAPPHNEHLVWQLVDADQRVILRSHRAPEVALQSAPTPGFAHAGLAWRVYGIAFAPTAANSPQRMLYVAQDGLERQGARLDATGYAIAAALVVGLACTLWLRVQLRRELRPLSDLSEAVRAFEPLQARAALPPASRSELAPMCTAISDLAQRLAKHVTNERAFTAHAAHALRTPLAGLDTQLAVALRECANELRPRLLRSRAAVSRLRQVVNALLTLFRSGAEPQWDTLRLDELLVHLPFDALQLEASGDNEIEADPDLMAAALLNLLDNSQRHGATRVQVDARREPTRTVITVSDNGSGIAPVDRLRLQAAIDAQDHGALNGLGLMLVDFVARAHRGGIRLLDREGGCTIQIRLGRAEPAAIAA